MPQQIDVPGMGVVEFPDGMDDDAITAAIQKNLQPATAEAAAEQRPFLEKLGSFARNVYENPPPTIAGARDIIKAAPAAAQELTFGADPEAARAAAGTALQAGMMGLPLAPGSAGGVGVLGAPRTMAGGARPPPIATVPPAGREEMLQAAGRLDVGVPQFLAAEGTAIPQFAAGIKNVPWAGEPIVQSAARLSEDLGRAKGDIAGGVVTPEAAGSEAKRGLTGYIKSGSQKPVEEAYGKVDALIDPEAMAPLTNTRALVEQLDAERARALIPGYSKAADVVRQAVHAPGMGYEGLKTLRSFMGEKTPQELVASGINPAESKRIYAALTKDLQSVIREAGGDAALSAWKEANALARLTSLQRQALTKITGVAGDAAPEAVFTRLMNYAGSKSTADIGRLRLARTAMGEEAWGEVSSAFINRMGMDPAGVFSPDRFVTAYGNLAAAAKNALFERQQLAALNDLFTVSKHVQDRITRFGNPSGTSRGVFAGLGGTALFTEPISVIGGTLGTRLVASALSRPAVARAAADVSRASLSGNPLAVRAAQARLYDIAAREGLVSAAGNLQQLPQRRRP
jgi:hypothetical protein